MKKMMIALCVSMILFSACSKQNIGAETSGAEITFESDLTKPSGLGLVKADPAWDNQQYYLQKIQNSSPVDAEDTLVYEHVGPAVKKTGIFVRIETNQKRKKFSAKILYTRNKISFVADNDIHQPGYSENDTLLLAETDAANRLVYSRSGTLSGEYDKHYFTYDANGRVSRIHRVLTSKGINGGAEYYYDYRLSYDSYSNLVSIKQMNAGPDNPNAVKQVNYAYDYSSPVANVAYTELWAFGYDLRVLQFYGLLNLQPKHMRIASQSFNELETTGAPFVYDYSNTTVDQAGNVTGYDENVFGLPVPNTLTWVLQ